MHLLHKKCGSRVRNQMICPVCEVVIERSDLVRGFELSKGNYVQIRGGDGERRSRGEQRDRVPRVRF